MITKLEVLPENQLKDIMSIWLDTNKKAHSFIANSYWEDNIEFVEKELPKADIYIATDENGKIIGFLGILESYIAGLFVSSDYQRQGIGNKLIKRAKADFEELSLTVYEKNKQAIHFYTKEGFKISETQIDEDTKEIELVMVYKN
ncbi:GNAT family N-acetyltransferase [Vagococcus bubulae]|uniref:N-acetyltransferase domain-containing protein n=1 Tax=Vagococcus bubulae TaxID=1977868 RepID=A0A429ZPC5_9ENTE|nr:GNAT family N-acetyltransferase [Vagococcus bubulae]RST95526.1 hypothetical protein CBF36_02260 [Vagococcus bubulae]